jgi:membrane protein implicated in regulation of membrane protease activity
MSGRKEKVYVHSGLWNTGSGEPIAAGDRVIVTAAKGMTVKVEKQRGGV